MCCCVLVVVDAFLYRSPFYISQSTIQYYNGHMVRFYNAIPLDGCVVVVVIVVVVLLVLVALVLLAVAQ